MTLLPRKANSTSLATPANATGSQTHRSLQPRGWQSFRKNGWLRYRLSLPSLQSKLTIPYALLTMILTAVGIFILTRLVTSSIRERFTNQLYEAGRVASDGIVLLEAKHLETLRIMSYTTGTAGAFEQKDTEKLESLLLPIVVNNRVQILTLVDRNGAELLTLALDPNTGQYLRTQGGDFSSFSPVANILDGIVDDKGDKYAGLYPTGDGMALFTSAAVPRSDGQLAGILLVGTYLDSLVSDLKARALADILLLDNNGNRLSTTLPPDDMGYELLDQATQVQAFQPSTQPQKFTLYRRGYQLVYAPFVIRHESIGWLGILLPDQFVVSTEATSRTSLSLMFTFGTLMVLLIGRLLAINISRPILWLRQMAEDVAQGNLQQTINVQRTDEIGELAESFNLMTQQLRERTEEAKMLLEESIQQNRELADINARLREMQMQIVRSEKLAAIGQLTAGIVHDVKNPLSAIQGMTEILCRDPRLSAEARQDIGIIHISAIKATKIVTDLLKFARQTPPELKSQDLRETVYTALYLNRYLIRKANVKLAVDISEQPVVVTYDAIQMEQVFINLIQNAVQAMPQGGTLKAVLTKEGTTARFILIDTGAGIHPDHLKRIFDPFYTTKKNGTGLGLSTSYGIVASHHGEILVHSVVGRGTRFTILLPIGDPREKTNPSQQMTSEGGNR